MWSSHCRRRHGVSPLHTPRPTWERLHSVATSTEQHAANSITDHGAAELIEDMITQHCEWSCKAPVDRLHGCEQMGLP
jgi:hypothetical protein